MSIQKATGNMYEWVDFVHSYLRGACPYACPYCYVQAIAKRFGNEAMLGPLRFDEKQLEVDYGNEKYRGKTIFIEHTHDLFHPDVDSSIISDVLENCYNSTSLVTFVFQTRNTMRAQSYWRWFPARCMVGTTIETTSRICKDSPPSCRALGLSHIRKLASELQTFVTIEPILEFDLNEMLGLIALAKPDFVNIGADSKGTGLQEPSKEKVLALIEGIKGLGIEIRTKRNLQRLIGGQP